MTNPSATPPETLNRSKFLRLGIYCVGASAVLCWAIVAFGSAPRRDPLEAKLAQRAATIQQADPLLRMRLESHLDRLTTCLRGTPRLGLAGDEDRLAEALDGAEARCNVTAVVAAMGTNDAATWALAQSLHERGFILPKYVNDALAERRSQESSAP